MFRTIMFKLVLALHYIVWAPILFVGLIYKPLNDFLVLTCARGVLVWARLIGGIK